MWIQAMKASLKFTLSQRSRGPCRDRAAGHSWSIATQVGAGVWTEHPELNSSA